MKHCLSILLLLCSSLVLQAQTEKTKARSDIVLVVHGGAGSMRQDNTSPQMEAAYKAALQHALKKGYSILKKGGTALDAVSAAIQVLEDDSLFNAGKGAVFTHNGKNELDASIMDGKTLKAGAVAGVTVIRNPITAARAVMEKSDHVLLAGTGAEAFAAVNGITIVNPSYFHTESKWRSLQRYIEQDSVNKDNRKKKASVQQAANHDGKYGTVGAVALDRNGNLAAGTSTGGMTNKRFGRIGDSPLIGAGTYADNHTCAVSCTGWGEYFIRLVMAKSVSDRIELKGMAIDDAAKEMIHQKLPALGGDGGLIGVDKEGNITMQFNTAGMIRGYMKDDKAVVELYR